jgi:hypothetical protein
MLFNAICLSDNQVTGLSSDETIYHEIQSNSLLICLSVFLFKILRFLLRQYYHYHDLLLVLLDHMNRILL